MFFSFLTGSKKQNIRKNSNYFCIITLYLFYFLAVK